MCSEAYKVDTGQEIGSVGDIKALCGYIAWHEHECGDIPDVNCLCQVNIPITLLANGYKVWEDKDMPGNWLFEDAS